MTLILNLRHVPNHLDPPTCHYWCSFGPTRRVPNTDEDEPTYVYDASAGALVWKATAMAWAYEYEDEDDAVDYLVEMGGMPRARALQRVRCGVPEFGIVSFVMSEHIRPIRLPRLSGVNTRTRRVADRRTLSWLREARHAIVHDR